MSDCIFCKIVAGDSATHYLWEDDEYVAFLDVRPIKPGHTLLIPKRHVDYVFDMGEAEIGDIFNRARMLSGPLCEASRAERIGIVVEGFEVPHVHVHLVPLHDDNDLNPENGRPASDEELDSMAQRIRSALADE